MKKTLYEIVGVARNATADAIDAAARAKMEEIKIRHQRGEAEAALEGYALKEAFAVLRDPVKRVAYDAKLDMADTPAPPATDRTPIVYYQAAESGGNDWRVYAGIAVALMATLGVMSGYFSYQAEFRLLDKAEKEKAEKFNARAWVGSLGPAEGATEGLQPASTEMPAKAFSLEEFERDKERRDAALRRQMERERREYDNTRRHEQIQNEYDNSRALGR
jgi:hypothetical protein